MHKNTLKNAFLHQIGFRITEKSLRLKIIGFSDAFCNLYFIAQNKVFI